MSAFTLEPRAGGFYLPRLGLWLDAHRAQKSPDRVVVSHAHSDHTAAHQEVLLTAATAQLMRARVAGERVEHRLPFGEPRVFAPGSAAGPAQAGPVWEVTLLPAGHILGSAMALIRCDGESLLYTGDFRVRPGHAAEACNPLPAVGCDIVLMETTFGRPQYRFPPAEQVVGEIVQFSRDALRQGAVPMLLAYSLGKSQELLVALKDANLPVMLHRQAVKLTHIYEQFGVAFPPYAPWDPAKAAGHVVICPPQASRERAWPGSDKLRTAVVTGWACDPSCRFRYGADAAFPLSDHADFPELVEFVRSLGPKRVLTCHGFAADFAQTLRELGFDARAMIPEEQMWLPLT